MKILFLSAWYPNKYDAMDGLFVRKHAQAVAAYQEVRVLFLKAVPHLGKAFFETHGQGGLIEHHLYYPAAQTSIGKGMRFIYYYYQAWKKLKKEWGLPEIIHVHILTRHACVAEFMRLRYGIPYGITEHWSRYIRGEFKGKIRKMVSRRVVKKAAFVSTVSEQLAQAMQKEKLFNPHSIVIRNVVDDFFFQVDPKAKSRIIGEKPKIILHVCCFDEKTKNNRGLLRSLSALSQIRSDFCCVFVGQGKDWEQTKDYALSLNLKSQVEFVGEKTPGEVRDLLEKATCMVLFSLYETASVVVCESLATGTPVVVSDIGAIAEVVDDGCGYRVSIGDEAALCTALDQMLDQAAKFESKYMQDKASLLFSSSLIGKRFSDLYSKIKRNK